MRSLSQPKPGSSASNEPSIQIAQNQALDTVSGAAIGSICAYVHEYGTPYQIERVSQMIDTLLSYKEPLPSLSIEQETNTTRSKTAKKRSLIKRPDWTKVRQELYVLAGDWLWMHAANHWRCKMGLKMNVPSVMMDLALKVKPVGGLGLSILMPPQGQDISCERKGKRSREDENKSCGPLSDLGFSYGDADADWYEEKDADKKKMKIAPTPSDELPDKEQSDPDKIRETIVKEENTELVKIIVTPPTAVTATEPPTDNEEKSAVSKYKGIYSKNESDNTNSVKWHAQVTMKNGRGNFHIGKYDTEQEAAFAVDLTLCLFHTDDSRPAANLASYEECNNVWKKYNKLIRDVRGADSIDMKNRSFLRRLIQSEVKNWLRKKKKIMKKNDKSTVMEVEIPLKDQPNTDAPEKTPASYFLTFIGESISSNMTHGTEPWISPLFYILLLFPPAKSAMVPRLFQKISHITCWIIHYILTSHSILSSEHPAPFPNQKIEAYTEKEQFILSTLVTILQRGDIEKNLVIFQLTQLLQNKILPNSSSTSNFNLMTFVNSTHNKSGSKLSCTEDNILTQPKKSIVFTAISLVNSILLVHDYDRPIYSNCGLNGVLCLKLRESRLESVMGEKDYGTFLNWAKKKADYNDIDDVLRMPILGNCGK